MGHSGAGKTSLAEAMLFAANATTRMGRVEDGNTVSDFEPEEQKRSTSLQVKLLPCIWKQTKVNILDTPGYADFVGESISALRVADAVVLVVSAPAGIEVGTEQMWQRAKALGLPVLVFLNKMDRENVEFSSLMDQLRDQLGRQCVPVNVPIGTGPQFKDVTSLIAEDFPAETKEMAGQHREQLMEAVAETDDALTEKYLDSGELTPEEISTGLYEGVRAAQLAPVLVGAATQAKGIAKLLDAVLAYLPAPNEAAQPPLQPRTVSPSTFLPTHKGLWLHWYSRPLQTPLSESSPTSVSIAAPSRPTARYGTPLRVRRNGLASCWSAVASPRKMSRS